MNPFEKHGLKHLSPSSLNLYAANPSLWVGRYLLGWEDEFGPAAARGTAIEAGLDLWLFDRSKATEAEAVALANFADRTQGIADDEHETERANIAPMLRQAMSALNDYPVPACRQMRVEYYANGVEVPIIGYFDYGFDGFDLDLKTTKACPSSIRPDHARQTSLYRAARNKPQKLLYVNTKKSAVYDLGDNEAAIHLRDLERQARALRHLLKHAETADDAARFFAPVLDDFRWSPITVEKADKLWRV